MKERTRQLKDKAINIFVNTSYDTLRKKTSLWRFVWNIVSAVFYFIFATVSLFLKNSDSKFAYWLILGSVVLSIAIVLTIVGLYRTQTDYDKKYRATVIKFLHYTIKLLTLVAPITLLVQGNSFGTGWEMAARIYSIVHLAFVLIRMSNVCLKLLLHSHKRRKYRKNPELYEKKARRKRSVYSFAQDFVRKMMDIPADNDDEKELIEGACEDDGDN